MRRAALFAMECGPPDIGQLCCEASGQEGGRALHDSDAEPLVAEVNDMLQLHFKQLRQYIDGRLSAHHDGLLQRLAMDDLVVRVADQAVAAPHDSWMAAAVGCADAAHGPGPRTTARKTTTGSSLSMSSEIQSSCGASGPRVKGVRSTKCSFDRNEAMKMHRSREAGRALSKMGGVNCDEASSDGTDNVQLNNVVDCQAAARRIVDSAWFEALTCILIASNLIWFGVEVQCLMGVMDDDIPTPFKVVEMLYTVCFTIELALYIYAYGLRVLYCGGKRAQYFIDLILVLISWLEIFLDAINGSSPRLEYARIIRIARTFRILRVLRIMKFFRPLRILIFSIMNTLRSLFWTLVLLLLTIYMFGVIFAMASSQALLNDTSKHPIDMEHYWGSLGASIFTLFKAITGGLDWEDAAEALDTDYKEWVVLFTVFIGLSHSAVLNIVTGVVCQTAIESAHQDQDMMVQSQLDVKEKYVRQLQALFQQVASPACGSLTLMEFEERLADDSLRAYFAAMDLTPDEAWTLFKLLDTSENYMINVDDFVSGCLKLRGNARSIDVHMLMYESKWMMRKLEAAVKSIEDVREQVGRFHPVSRATWNMHRGTPAGHGNAHAGEVASHGVQL